MSYFYLYLTIIIIGLSGIIAQALLLRELLVSFCGNELTLGIVLANWLIAEAGGVFVIGKLGDRVKNRVNLAVIFQILFSLAFFLSVYLARGFKNILGLPFSQAVGIYAVFWVSFIAIFPAAFSHGALFSLFCKIYPAQKQEEAIGRVYAFETIGTLFGGIILTYILLPQLNSFQIAVIIALANFIILPFLFKNSLIKSARYLILFITAGLLYLFFSGGISALDRFSVSRQYPKMNVLDSRNSIYGNIVVTQDQKQRTFFYNGIPAITAPYPDIAAIEEFAHLPLLYHFQPKDILIIGGGAGGLINEVLKHPVEKVTYLELDPLLIEMLKKYPSGLTDAELKNDKVNIINVDARFFLRVQPGQYDIIFIGLASPADLAINRFFSAEFFSLAAKRMSRAGILVFRLPGSLTYLSRELRDLNACIINALKPAFKYVHIIPGENNLFLASNSKDITTVTSRVIAQRINQRNIQAATLTPEYINYRLSTQWAEWLKRSLENATSKINKDFTPFAVFEMLVFWNKQFSVWAADLLVILGSIDLRAVILFILILFFGLFYIFKRSREPLRLKIVYSIATTGFFGMLASLILIFSFQAIHGYIYKNMSILISIFMAGLAAGSIFITRYLSDMKKPLRLFIVLEITIAVFSFALAPIIFGLAKYCLNYSTMLFSLIAFICGLLIGLEFPLAAKLYLQEKEKFGNTAGILYCADLIGGWIAGVFSGVIFLPVLGLYKTCLVMALVKISSLLLLILPRKNN